MFDTRNTSSIAKKFSPPSQFSSEKKIFNRSILNTHSYRPLTDIASQQKHPFVRYYSTSHDGPFLDPKNDVAFKKLFATEDHKPLLVNFWAPLAPAKGVPRRGPKARPPSLLSGLGDRTIKKYNNKQLNKFLTLKQQSAPFLM